MTDTQAPVRIYLPDTFLSDVVEADPDLWQLWERVLALPRSRRGGGTGRWAEFTADEARAVYREATYRAEFWLTDAYGPDHVQPHERTAGRAAKRVAESIEAALTETPA